MTLWSTQRKQPLFLLTKIFDHAPVDISWSSDGYTLLVCSLDGSVTVIRFTCEELGTPISDADRDLHMQKVCSVYMQQALYTCLLQVHGVVASGPRVGQLAETPTQLVLEAASVQARLVLCPVL